MDKNGIISFKEYEVGKTAGWSKSKMCWLLQINSERAELQLIASRLTSKRRLFFKNQLIFKGLAPLQFKFAIGCDFITIRQQGDSFSIYFKGILLQLLQYSEVVKPLYLARRQQKKQLKQAGVSEFLKHQNFSFMLELQAALADGTNQMRLENDIS